MLFAELKLRVHRLQSYMDILVQQKLAELSSNKFQYSIIPRRFGVSFQFPLNRNSFYQEVEFRV